MAALQTTGLFGTLTRTRVLLAISMMGETHASELAKLVGISLSRAQKTIDNLERSGIVGVEEGKARRIRENPRNPFLPELALLLEKMSVHDTALQIGLAELRRRPRRSGKELRLSPLIQPCVIWRSLSATHPSNNSAKRKANFQNLRSSRTDWRNCLGHPTAELTEATKLNPE